MKALILSGGGSKGAAQVGVIDYLLEQNPNLDYDIYAGNSVGALSAMQLATGPLKESYPKLKQIWLEEVKGSRSVWQHHLWYYILAGICFILFFFFSAFVSFIISAHKLITIFLGLCGIASFYLPYYSLNNVHSLYNTEPLRNIIINNIDVDKLKKSDKILKIGVLSFTTGKYKSIGKEESNIVDWVMASSSFPVVFPMHEIDGEYWTDGASIDIAPIEDVIELGANEIDIILTNPIDPGEQSGLPCVLKQLGRHIDIVASELLRRDIEDRKSIPGLKIRLFIPDSPLTNNQLSFDPEKIKNMFEKGRVIAEKVLNTDIL